MGKKNASKFAAKNAERKVRNAARHEARLNKYARYDLYHAAHQRCRNIKRAAKREEIRSLIADGQRERAEALAHVPEWHNWPSKPQYKDIPGGNFMSSSATLAERDQEWGRWLHLRMRDPRRAATIVHNVLYGESKKAMPLMDEQATPEMRNSHTRSDPFALMRIVAALNNGHMTPRDFGVEF